MLYPAANNPLVGEIKNLSPVPANADPYCDKIVLLMHMDTVSSADPYADSVVLAMPMNGIDGSTSFLDEKGHRVTVYGAHVSNAQSVFGGASAYFDGTGDYLWLEDSADWHFGSSDFTIEFFARWNSVAGRSGVIGQCSGSGTTSAFQITTSGTTLQYSTAGYSAINSNVALSSLTWYHIAVVRSGETITLYLDGNSVGSLSVGTAELFNSSNKLGIGCIGEYVSEPANTTYGTCFAGYIDDLRITKGVARYDGNFTPPTDQIPSTSKLIDEGGHTVSVGTGVTVNTSNKVLGSASARFDGTSNGVVTIQDYYDLRLAADYTISFFVKVAAIPTSPAGMGLVGKRDSTSAFGNWVVLLNGPGSLDIKLQLHTGMSWTNYDIGTATLNTWHHIAFTFESGILRTFFDGEKIVEAAPNFSSASNSNPIRLGVNSISGYFIGYIDELCIWESVAKWVDSFTPPTAPGAICGQGEARQILQQLDFRSEWEIFGSLAGTEEISWALLTPVSIDLTDSWEIFDWSTSLVTGFSWSLASVESSVSQISWGIATVTALDQTLSWSSSSALSADFSQSFSIDGPLEVTQVSTWSLVATTAAEVQLSWATELFSAVTTISSWSVKQAIDASFGVSWNLLVVTDATTVNSWSLGTETFIHTGYSWSLGIPTEVIETLSWQHESLSSVNSFSWSVRL